LYACFWNALLSSSEEANQRASSEATKRSLTHTKYAISGPACLAKFFNAGIMSNMLKMPPWDKTPYKSTKMLLKPYKESSTHQKD